MRSLQIPQDVQEAARGLLACVDQLLREFSMAPIEITDGYAMHNKYAQF